MITLPDDTYNNNLIKWVYQTEPIEGDKLEYDLLRRVCECYLHNPNHPYSISNVKLTEEEKRIVIEREYFKADCKELRARFLDVALQNSLIRGTERLEAMQKCSDIYLSLVETVACHYKYEYLVRSVLVRESYNLYNEGYCQRLITIIISSDINPCWIQDICEFIQKRNAKDNVLIKKILAIYSERKESKSNDHNWQEQYVELLYSTKEITTTDYHKLLALVYERRADSIIENSAPNTFNVGLHQIYQDAFREINLVKKEFASDWLRLQKKCEAANLQFVEKLSVAGIQTPIDIPQETKVAIKRHIIEIVTFDDPMDIFKHILTIPYYPAMTSFISRIKKNISNSSIFDTLFSGTSRINEDGNTIGISNEESWNLINARLYSRQFFLYHLWTLVGYYNANRIGLKEESVYNMLELKHSKYVNDEELVVWSQAITEIISGNAIIGAYALMPQLEKLIRQLAETKIGDTTHLANCIQDEKTFGTVIRDLKDYMNEDFNRELSLFLTDRVDVGLRNSMMHGLAKPFEVQMYSIMVLYLSLKLFILEDKFLFIDEIK